MELTKFQKDFIAFIDEIRPRLTRPTPAERAVIDETLRQEATPRGLTRRLVSADERPALERELRELMLAFDVAYRLTDDHAYFREQQGIEERIFVVRDEIQRSYHH